MRMSARISVAAAVSVVTALAF
ncbi:MAG: hypothetical protein QOJ37_2478, partial [Pseudonocardiales bacterium]|nr:hypothetical protein [Pseudonocardiales bacterium]